MVFYSEADTHRDESLAIEAFNDAIEAYKLGASWGSSDVEIVGGYDHLTLGEQNYSAYLELDGIRIGNLIVVRKGILVYSFILVGPYVKYAQTLYDLIGPKLDLVTE